MARRYPDALSLTRKVLRTLIILNPVFGILILALLIASLIDEGIVMKALGVRPVDGAQTLILGMRLIMVVGICSVPIAQVVLIHLKAIVDTVSLGDPFVAENAARLQSIAWAVLGLEVLHLVIGALVAAASSDGQPLDIDWNFSLTRWLAVLLCFVLARVFQQGTRMREELAGTV